MTFHTHAKWSDCVGWVVTSTKPGVDPALAILLSHLMLKEYSTKEIKKYFKPQFPFQPPWGMTPMM